MLTLRDQVSLDWEKHDEFDIKFQCKLSTRFVRQCAVEYKTRNDDIVGAGIMERDEILILSLKKKSFYAID